MDKVRSKAKEKVEGDYALAKMIFHTLYEGMGEGGQRGRLEAQCHAMRSGGGRDALGIKFTFTFTFIIIYKWEQPAKEGQLLWKFDFSKNDKPVLKIKETSTFFMMQTPL